MSCQSQFYGGAARKPGLALDLFVTTCCLRVPPSGVLTIKY